MAEAASDVNKLQLQVRQLEKGNRANGDVSRGTIESENLGDQREDRDSASKCKKDLDDSDRSIKRK